MKHIQTFESFLNENYGEFATEEYERIKKIVDNGKYAMQKDFESITDIFMNIDSAREAKQFLVALANFKHKWDIEQPY